MASRREKNENSQGKKATLSGVPGLSPNIAAFFMLVAPILFVWFCFVTIHVFHGSLLATWNAVILHAKRGALATFVHQNVPSVTLEGTVLYFTWVGAQAMMYVYVPGPNGYGQCTPGGNIIKYHCNGLRCWVLTHIVVIGAVVLGYIRSTLLYDNLGTVFILANAFGLFMTLFAYVKAYTFPNHPEDRRFSGSVLYDIFMGIEHNPALGTLDFKLFFNGRPGILAWTLINLSCAVKQYHNEGYVTNAMILVNFLHALYVLDFFFKEDWYLRTMDIAHDHFGFYLAWGDLTWLPFLYTLQCFYMVQNPVLLPLWAVVCILILGLGGYYIFRSSNTQKDEFRKAALAGKTFFINGKPAVFVPAKYTTTDGQTHFSPLLASGWWGLSRHFNYVGDLMISLAYCLPCGFGHILPYFYIIYMTILLLHRVYRDNVRCKEKYGRYWDDYCALVPYKIVPGLF